MPLLRVSENKLAANRANARKSRGPSTPHGKQHSSQNACKHHLYARKFTMPETWEDRIRAAIAPAVASVEDPAERAFANRYFYLLQWLIELDSFEVRLINQSTLDHDGDLDRGLQHFVRTNPLFQAIETRIHTLNRQANRARIDWNQAQHAADAASAEQTIPQVVEKKSPIAPPQLVVTNHPGAAIKTHVRLPDHRAQHATDAASTEQTIPQIIENTTASEQPKPLVWAAGAGSASSGSARDFSLTAHHPGLPVCWSSSWPPGAVCGVAGGAGGAADAAGSRAAPGVARRALLP